MQPVDNSPMPSPVSDPSPSPAPAPAPLPAPSPAPQYSNGSVGSFFDGVTLTDVGMVAICACAGLLIIKYYRDRINYLQKEKTQTSKDVQEIKTNVQNLIASTGGQYRKLY
jgi:hypothetical protein